MEKQIEGINSITDLLIDFDEMGFTPTTPCPNAEAYAIEWREKITNALKGYRKISEIEKWTIREISEGIDNIIAEFERLKSVGFKHDDKWRFDNLVSDIRDFMKEYEEQKNGKAE